MAHRVFYPLSQYVLYAYAMNTSPFKKKKKKRMGLDGAKGAVPGVNRSERQEQHTNATLQAAQLADACAQTRECARCQGSVGEGAGKVARSVIKGLFERGGRLELYGASVATAL